jgi:hypothetical protein
VVNIGQSTLDNIDLWILNGLSKIGVSLGNSPFFSELVGAFMTAGVNGVNPPVPAQVEQCLGVKGTD